MSWAAILAWTLLAGVACFATSAGMDAFVFDHAVEWESVAAAVVGGAGVTFAACLAPRRDRATERDPTARCSTGAPDAHRGHTPPT